MPLPGPVGRSIAESSFVCAPMTRHLDKFLYSVEPVGPFIASAAAAAHPSREQYSIHTHTHSHTHEELTERERENICIRS